MDQERRVALGERVFWLRTERHWTQDELAERSGVARRTIVLTERGRTYPQLGTLRKLARTFGMRVDELVHRSNGEATTSRESERAQEGRAVVE